jgi:hypothetical protein
MLLVPRQLKRHGMTGAVPYYGGRLTPAHIHGIEQSARRGSPRPAAPVAPPALTPPPASVPPPAPLRGQRTPQAVLDSLTYLRDTGVITPREFDDLRARAGF